MNDLISRADAIEAVCTWGTTLERNGKTMMTMVDVKHAFIKTIEELPSADRPSGEWKEKEVCSNDDSTIEEWQSARCSECGKYHTTPYMYYFDNFNYCPNCGAKMDGERKEP